MSEEVQTEILQGTVEDIKFRNEQNGYTVLEVGCEDELVTAVGTFSDISVGESVRLSGAWTFHSTFGRQFKVEAFEREMPATAEQLYNYLAAGAVKGIGPATAQKIIEKFGENAFDVLENEPKKLATIKGISLEKAEKMQESFKKQFAVRNIMIALETYGMSPRECIAAYEAFGSNAVERVTKNPFELCDADTGIGFERAEAIADALPNPPESEFRVRAGITHIVRQNLYSNGHTCIPREKLLKIAADYLSAGTDAVDRQIDALTASGALTAKELNGREFIFLTSAYRDEKTIADRIKILLRFPPPQCETLEKDIEKQEKQDGITYAETQREAIKTAVSRGVLILTGGPGTGKTTVARILGKILKEKEVLRIGNLYEYKGRDFCGQYIGETAPKTSGMCRDAYGSVLFIDEAYSLYRGDDNSRDYGIEAIDTLISEMENHKDDLVVIMAGYNDDMEKLMDGNRGLKSRMPYTIEFPNFTRGQLFEIYKSMAADKFKIADDLYPAAKAYFEGLSDEVLNSKNFSNARFVRNLFERTWAKAAMRCQLEGQKSVALCASDFTNAASEKDFAFQIEKKIKLGF